MVRLYSVHSVGAVRKCLQASKEGGRSGGVGGGGGGDRAAEVRLYWN